MEARHIDVKKVNRNRIYRFVHQQGKTSRTEISAALALSPPTVLQNVKELMDRGLIVEDGEFESTGGRKAAALSVNTAHRMAIGLDITKNHISVVAADLAGNVIASSRIHHAFVHDAHYAEILDGTLDWFLTQHELERERIIGIGISLPGIVDKTGTKVIFSHVLGLQDVPLSFFCPDSEFPEKLINDANAGGFAEAAALGPGCNMLYLSLSNSVGGAIYINGELFEGENQRAGEFGHMTLKPGGKTCYCGRKGCIDAYCSAPQLSEDYGGRIDAFFDALNRAEPHALDLWRDYTANLAVLVKNLRMAYDSDIVLGGYVGSLMGSNLDGLRRQVAELDLFDDKAAYLHTSHHPFETSALGAALLFVKEYVDAI